MKKRTSTLFRRGTAYLLALMLCVSTVQVTAFAADGDTPPEENASAPTVVLPDEPQSAPEPSTYNAEASSSSKDVDVTLKDDGSLEVGNYPSPKEDGSKTDYEGIIKDEKSSQINQPASSTASGSSSSAPAKLEGTITETSNEPAKEEDKGEGTEDQPAEGEEPKDKVISEGTIKGDEKTDDMDRTDTLPPTKEEPVGTDNITVNPGDGNVKGGENVNEDDSVKVDVNKDNDGKLTPNDDGSYGGTGKTDFSVDTDKLENDADVKAELEKKYNELLNPEGKSEAEYEKVGDTLKNEETGVTTQTTEQWKKEPIPDVDGRFNGYKVVETTTVTQENLPAPSVEPEVPKDDRENGVTVKPVTDEEGKTIENKYEVVTVSKDEAGNEITETKTVTITKNEDGGYQVVTVYKDQKGAEITETKNVFNGTMKVVTTTIVTTTYKPEDVKVEVKEDNPGSVTVGVTVTEGEGHGKLDTTGLQPEDMSDKVAYKVNVSDLRIRSEANTTTDENIVGTVEKDSIVFISETKTVGKQTWGKIGEGQWICLDLGNIDNADRYAGQQNKPNQYKVSANSGVRVRSTPNSNVNNNIVKSYSKGKIVTIVGETNGWLITSDGYYIYGSNMKKVPGSDRVTAYSGEQYKVTASAANLRDAANSNNDAIDHTVVYKDELLYIVGKKGDWFVTSNGKYIHSSCVEPVGPADPVDGKTNIYTDLYGYPDTNEEFTGRPDGTTSSGGIIDDQYNTTGNLYKINDKTPICTINGEESTLYGNIADGGLIFVEGEPVVINGKKYGLVGKTHYGHPLYVQLNDNAEPLTNFDSGFLYYNKHGLSSAVGVNLSAGGNQYNVHQFVVRDENGREHYVYCSDLSVRPNNNQGYGMTNVEDASFLDEDQKMMINAIASNGYWGTSKDEVGSMDSFKKWLVEIGYAETTNDLGWLTPGIAMTATQTAIWHYGNSSNKVQLKEEDLFPKTSYGNTLTTDELNNLKDLYGYLTSTEALKKNDKFTGSIPESTKLLNASSVKDVSVTVTKTTNTTVTNDVTNETTTQTTNDAEISFVLDVQPGLLKDMVITVRDPQDATKIYGTYKLAGTSEISKGIDKFFNRNDKTYTLKVEGLPNGTDVTIQLEGIQDIQKGAYLISAQGGYTESQTFISVEEGTRAFNLNMKLNLSVETAQATVTTTTTPEVTKTEQINREWSWDTKTTQKVVEPDPEEPENPTTPPEDPTTPPPTPRDPDPDPSDDPEIPDEPVPLTYIPDEPVPQAPLPPEDLIDIFDGDVPLASPYGTGDNSTVWYLIAVISVAGLFGLRLLERKANGENAK